MAPLPLEGVSTRAATSDPTLSCFIVDQYHYQHVARPLLLEQLDQLGIDISAGQLNGILTERKAAFTTRRSKCCGGVGGSSYVQVTTREPGTRGTTASVPSSATSCSLTRAREQSRENFLEVLCRPTPITRSTTRRWPTGSGKSWPRRCRAVDRGALVADEAQGKRTWPCMRVTSKRHVRIATEGALLGI